MLRILHIVNGDDAPSRFADRIEKLHPGLQVDSADSLNEAMERIADEVYDCVVYDNHQSGTPCLTVLRSIRGQFVNCPFILSTNEEIALSVREAFAADGDAYVVITEISHNGEKLAKMVETVLLHPEKIPVAAQAQEESIQERLFYSVAGNLPQALLLLDEDGEIVYANQVAEYLFGNSDTSQLVGVHIRTLLIGEKWNSSVAVRELIRGATTPKNNLRRLRFNRREGLAFESDVCLYPVAEGTERFTAIVIYNATFPESDPDNHECTMVNVFPKEPKQLTVLAICDGIVVQSGLQRLLREGSEDFSYMEFSPKALQEIGLQVPDVIVFACSNLDKARLERLKDVIVAAGRLPVLMVCMFGDQEFINDAIAEGVDGVILGESDFDIIPKAVRLVSQGSAWFPRSMVLKAIGVPHINTSRMLKHIGRPSELTSREQDVLKLLARGYKNKSIAEQLGLQYRTVVTHVYNIYRKLNINNRTEAIHYAITNRLVRVD